MKISKQARRQAKELFRGCLRNGLLDENRVRQAVVQMLAVRPRGCLAILSHFQRLVKLDEDRRSVRVESVISLDAAAQSTIKTNVQRLYGPGLNFTFTQDPALLGGVRIRVGSDVFDGTIQARLKEVEQAFEA